MFITFIINYLNFIKLSFKFAEIGLILKREVFCKDSKQTIEAKLRGAFQEGQFYHLFVFG